MSFWQINDNNQRPNTQYYKVGSYDFYRGLWLAEAASAVFTNTKGVTFID